MTSIPNGTTPSIQDRIRSGYCSECPKLASAIFSLVFAGGANAQSFQSIQNCRQLVDGADRVACYDALKPADAPQPKIEPAAAPPHEEQSCRMVATLLAGAGNCQDGDIVRIDMDARDVVDMVQAYCDFGSQILTLPDNGLASLTGQPKVALLCKYHRRSDAPSK